MSSTTSTNPLADELRAAVAKIDGVTLVDSTNGRYYTVKLAGKTLGYVNVARRACASISRSAPTSARASSSPRRATSRRQSLLRSFAPAPREDRKRGRRRSAATHRPR